MSRLLTVARAPHPDGRDCTQIVADAKSAAAEIVVFPEMYSNGYARFDPTDPAARARWCAGAESLDGDFVGRFRDAAEAHRMHVVATFLEKAGYATATLSTVKGTRAERFYRMNAWTAAGRNQQGELVFRKQL